MKIFTRLYSLNFIQSSCQYPKSKFFIPICFIFAFFLNTNAQNLLQNGNFESHNGTILSLEDWSGFGGELNTTNNNTSISFKDYDLSVGSINHTSQRYDFIEGVEYTITLQLKAFENYPGSIVNYSDLFIVVRNPNVGLTQSLDTIDMEDYIQSSFGTLSFNFIPDYNHDYLTFDVRGFDFDDNGDEDDYFMDVEIDNVVLESIHGPNFHFETTSGLETEVFCNESTVIVNAIGSQSVDQYKIGVKRRQIMDCPDADFTWMGATGWITPATGNIGLVDLQDLSNSLGFQLENGYEYEILLAIKNEYSAWWGITHTFTKETDPDVSFQITDDSGVEKYTFCVSDDIYFYGEESENELAYSLKIKEMSSGATTPNWEVESGWIDGTIGNFNLSEFVVSLGQQFIPAHSYKIQLSLRNGCMENSSKTKTINVTDCCPATDLSCYVKFNQVYLTWESNMNLSNYAVELSFSDPMCCTSSGNQSSVIYKVKEGNSFKLPQGISDCFAWRVISSCVNQSIISDWSCSTCISNEFQGSTQNSNFKVFPNPTFDVLNIDFGLNNLEGRIVIMDMPGKVIYEYESIPAYIDLSKLPSGIYFLKIMNNDQILHEQRIFKN